MNDLLFPILVLLLSVAAIVTTIVFFGWAILYFGRRGYRRAARLQFYVPIDAKVTRIWGRQLHVEYEFRGAKIANRFTTTQDVLRQVEQSKQVALRIDPDYPSDAVVDPAFAKHAVACDRPNTLGAKTLAGYALRLLGCLLAAGCLVTVFWWLVNGKVDSWSLVIVWISLPVSYVICLLIAATDFKARNGDHLMQLQDDKSKAP